MTTPAAEMCAFDSNTCSRSMSGRGGFDEHHEYPKFLGGDDHAGALLRLCPNHHRRQHALIRYLVEAHENGRSADWQVLRRFTPAERTAATFAIDGWTASGAPAVAHWGVDAAT